MLDGGVVDGIARLALRFVEGRDDLLGPRCTDGWVLDGHGDLIADDIFFLPDGPRVLDCLDFDDRLRHVDALDDVVPGAGSRSARPSALWNRARFHRARMAPDLRVLRPCR